MKKSTDDRYYFTKRYAVWLAAAMLLFLIIPSSSLAVSVKASLSPETFSTTRSARLTITVTDTQSADLELPDVEGLSFHERGTNRQFQMINNKSSSSVTYTYLVQALASGSYTIPPITVKVSGSTIKTRPISCTVTESNPPVSSPRNSTSADLSEKQDDIDTVAFIKMIPEKSEGFIGEIIPARIKAYFNRGSRARITSLPALKGEGVLIDPLDGEPQQSIETVNGVSYNVVTWNTALTGIKEGIYDLEVELDATVQVQSKQQRRAPPGFEDDFFQDRFFSDFFTRYESQPIKVVGQPVTMKIHDLPAEGKPDNFSGAVGLFSFELEVSPTSIGPGDPITLKMTVKGTGNFDNVKAPSLTSEEGLKSYSPTAEFIESDGSHSGEKVFEQAVVVTDSGSRSIPPVTFSFFDPEKARYQTLFSDPVPITVASTPLLDTGAALPLKQKQAETAPANEERFPMLAPVKLSSGNQLSLIRPIFLRPVFFVTATVILTALCLVTGLRIRKNHLTRNPELVRQKKISRVRETLLRQLARKKDLQEQEYLVKTQDGIRTLLGLLWQTEAASLTTSDIILRLGNDHPVTRLFTWADRSSYGAHILSDEEKQQLHETITNSIRELS